MAGKRVKCPGCAQPFIISLAPAARPAPDAPAAPPARAAAVVPARAAPARRAPSRPTAEPAHDDYGQPAQVAPPLFRAAPASPAASLLTPKWIAIGSGAAVILIVVILALSGVFSSDPNPEVAGGNTPGNRAIDRPQPSASASPAVAPPPPAAKIPKLQWSKDSVARPIGVAAAAVRSLGTEIQLILPPGTHADRALPCVFICPAGSNLLTGVPFGDTERQDFYGLLERGIAVCFYTLDGTVKDYESEPDFMMAVKMGAYLRTGGGLGNLQDAIETVLASAPAIDPARLGAIGHSSAGTVALTGAKNDPRIVAVAALAPILDIPLHLGDLVDALPGGVTQQLYRMNPATIEKLSADVFLFVADDDPKNPPVPIQAFTAKHAEKVKLQRIATGGHGGAYQQGLTPGMDFLAARLRATPIPGAGKIVAGAAALPAPSALPATPAPPEPQAIAPKVVEAKPNPETYWTKSRSNGVALMGAGSFVLMGDWPEGYGVSLDRRGAGLSLGKAFKGKPLGARAIVVDQTSPRLVSEGALDKADGKIGIDLANQRIILPPSQPRIVPAMGGGQVAIYDCGEDTELDLPTREAVIAFIYEEKVVLVHLSVPREEAKTLEPLIASVRSWGLRGKPDSKTKPYTELKR